MEIKIKKPTWNSILNLAFLMAFFVPSYIINEMPFLYGLLRGIRYISVIYCVCIYLAKKTPINKIVLIIILFYFYDITLALLGRGVLSVAITYFLSYVPIAIIIDYNMRKNSESCLAQLSFMCIVWLMINALTWTPNGLFDTSYGRAFFLGIRTRAIDVALPAMIFSMLYAVLQLQLERKLRAFIVPLLVIVPFFWFSYMEDVSNGIVCSVLMILLLLFGEKVEARKLKWVYVATIILNIAVVFFRIQNVFQWLIVDILGESLSLSNRTFIWDGAILRWIQSIGTILFGNGVGIRDSFYVSDMGNAHNQYLQFLVDGGCVKLVLYFVMIFISVKKICNAKRSKLASIALGGLCITSVVMLSECCCETAYFPVVLVVLYHLYNLVLHESNQIEEKNNGIS